MKNSKKYMRDKQRQRRRQKKLASVTVELSQKQMRFIKRMREHSSYPKPEFNRRALLLGAAFAFNSGGKRGGKVRVKPPL